MKLDSRAARLRSIRSRADIIQNVYLRKVVKRNGN